MKYEYQVFTLMVPWKADQTPEQWPYLPSQEMLLAKLMSIGAEGWAAFEHVWSPLPASDTELRAVNIWARRLITVGVQSALGQSSGQAGA
jgi:hypothetical protein